MFAAAYGGLALSAHLAAALPLVALVGVAYGLSEPAERSLVAMVAPEGRHGSAFGWYALVQGMMALPASFLAGWLWQQGPRGPQAALAVTAILSALACGVLVASGRVHTPKAAPDH